MEAHIRTVKDLFQPNARYIIPIFQRPYVWNQEDQWDPLWEDVRILAERFIEAAGDGGQDVNAESLTGTHFLGAIVLQQIPTPATTPGRWDVIDGQQRMLTIQLLLDAAQEVFETEGIEMPALQLSKLVLNDKDFVKDDELFKVWPSTVDQESFRAAMTNNADAGDLQDSLVVQAHEFFQLQTREWILEGKGERKELRANALLTAMIGLLEFVVIDVKSLDDAYKIFETLNARGTPLIASDLIKNFILHTAKERGLDPSALYKDYLLEFDNKWWRTEIRQGRLIRPRIDVFLNYWLEMRIRDEVNSQDVFKKFQDYSKMNNLVMTDLAHDMRRVGNSYKEFENFSPHSLEGTFFYRWNVMQAGVVTPLLLLLFSTDNNVLTADARTSCLRTIESYLVRRMICRMTAKDYNRVVLELIDRISRDIDRADQILSSYLLDQTSESRLWPKDDQVANAILDLPIYRLLTRGRLRFILEAIEEHMRSEKTEGANGTRGKLTIEHILPQGWQQHWPLGESLDQSDSQARIVDRDRLKHTLGNLTLLNNKLNPSVSNSSWANKKEAIYKHSMLFMNKNLIDKWGDGPEFQEAQIRERGEHMAKIICRIWRR